MADTHPFWLAGVATTSPETVEVTSPRDGSVVGRVAVPTAEHVEQAVAAAAGVAAEAAALPAHARAAALTHGDFAHA